VEAELGRIPPNVGRRYASHLWSICYLPQVAAAAGRGLPVRRGASVVPLEQACIKCAAHCSASSAKGTKTHACVACTARRRPSCHACMPRTPQCALPRVGGQLGYAVQVSGRVLAEELRELLPDYELAHSGGCLGQVRRAGCGGCGSGGGGRIVEMGSRAVFVCPCECAGSRPCMSRGAGVDEGVAWSPQRLPVSPCDCTAASWIG
jgi:hypothetical protein